jgi:long-chain acyl-CoA synthetase
MHLSGLIEGLATKTGAIHVLENGKPVRHPYSILHKHVLTAREVLRGWGVRPGSRVGIYAPNSYQWLVYDLALIAMRAISVPFTEDFKGAIDDTLLERYRVSLLLIAKSQSRYFPDKPAHIAFIDSENDHVRALEHSPAGDIDEEDQLSLVFSSGSAGGLKGLVISRSGVTASLPPILDAIGLHRGDRLFLFLPMSGFQQRFLCYGALWYDFDVILTDFAQLFPAMTKLNPTVFLAPPVFYQMVHAEFGKLSIFKQKLRLALGRMLSLIPSLQLRRAAARALFTDFHRQFGKSVRILITGMAPIRHNILEFFDRMQLPISEAYGMVEVGVMTYRPGKVKKYDSVGIPLSGVHFSFLDDGEVLVHRQNPVTLRYFQCAPGENERTFISPTTISTGDIGVLGSDGYLRLRGRKKELIITAGGHKIHPEVIEHEINNCLDVANSVVFWSGGAPHLTSVIALNDAGDPSARNRARKHVANLKTGKNAIPYISVLFSDEPFTRDNGMLRPNMKIDRKRIVARYEKVPISQAELK